MSVTLALALTFASIFAGTAAAQPAATAQTGTRAYFFTDSAISARRFCDGDAALLLPVLGACPAGSIGIATCTQPSLVPRALRFDQATSAFVCELDYASAVPNGAVQCNYSRCFTVREPTLFDAYFGGDPLEELSPRCE
jgi:hypothetical protein